MIPQPQLDAVYDFLSQNQDGILENIYKTFQRKFSDSANIFNFVFILFQAVCDNLLPQRLRFICIYIVHEVFRTQSPFPLQDVCVQSLNAFEKKFVNGLLNKEQYGQWNVKQLMDEYEKANEGKTEKCGHSRELRQVITDSPAQETLCSVDKFRYLNTTFLGFELDFLRPIPEIEVEQQCQWFELNYILDSVWDYNIELNDNPIIFIRELITKAQNQSLTKEEAQELINLFNENKKYVLECGINPKMFPNIVERNPDVSSYLLARINQCDLNIHEYLDCLITMKVSLQSLEVVNKVSNSIKLPEPFVHMFVTKCIESCEEHKQKQQQVSRFVRLVSLFIKQLIKSKVLDPKKLYTELQGFCIEFSKVAETSQLFKAVKNSADDDKQTQQHQ